MALRAGLARRDITPAIPMALAGYSGRTDPWRDIHDSLEAKAVVVHDTHCAIGLLIADVRNIDAQVARRVREEVALHSDLSPEHVMVAAIHTHSGPAGISPSVGDEDRSYVDWLVKQLAAVILDAANRQQDVRLVAGTGRLSSVSVNRRTGGPAPDPTLGVLLIESTDGTPLGVLVNFACHPTVLGPRNLSVSADYPGAACRAIERALGVGVVAMFTNGAAGDVNPFWLEESFAECERIGSLVAVEALRVVHELRAVGRPKSFWHSIIGQNVTLPASSKQPGTLRGSTSTVRLRTRLLPTVETCEAEVQRLRAGVTPSAAKTEPIEGQDSLALLTQYFGTLATLKKAPRIRDYLPREVESEVQVLILGEDVALVGLPGEIFAETGLQIKHASSFAHTFVVTYANGYLGYLPPQPEYRAGGYEVGATVVEPGAIEELKNVALTLLSTP